MRGMETKWRRLGDIVRGTETVSRGLGVILLFWRLGGHFCGPRGASAPPFLAAEVQNSFQSQKF